MHPWCILRQICTCSNYALAKSIWLLAAASAEAGCVRLNASRWETSKCTLSNMNAPTPRPPSTRACARRWKRAEFQKLGTPQKDTRTSSPDFFFLFFIFFSCTHLKTLWIMQDIDSQATVCSLSCWQRNNHWPFFFCLYRQWLLRLWWLQK